ncbi:MAG: DUF11 domain-containing protein, partial [Chloroflexi bacterium]|nr:DUF11 domain-containing protein [Chloroflexota bacterium]
MRINNGNYEVGSWDGTNHVASAAIPAGDINRWVHLVGAYDGAAWRLYRNGAQVASAASTTGAVAVNQNWAIGARGNGTERFFNGTIDEVAVYNRPLSAQEALDHYRRGALRVRFQVRSCAASNCAGASAFVGPDGTPNTYFSEQNNSSLTPPSFNLVGVSPNLYFQYRAFLESDDASALPAIKSVKAGPAHSGIVTSPPNIDCSGLTIVVCNIGSIAPAQNAIITITAQVDPATRGTIFNSASVSGNEFDRDQANNTSTRSTDINAFADLSVTKSAAGSTVVPGRTLTYTLVARNNGGPSVATNTRLVDTLPNGVTPKTLDAGCSALGGNVTCALGALGVNAAVTRTLVVTVDASTPAGLLTNTVSIQSDESDANVANNTASVGTVARPEIDLVVRKFPSSDPVFAGNTLTYTVVVSNVGPSVATGVRLTDTLPAGFAFDSVPGGCVLGN